MKKVTHTTLTQGELGAVMCNGLLAHIKRGKTTPDVHKSRVIDCTM